MTTIFSDIEGNSSSAPAIDYTALGSDIMERVETLALHTEQTGIMTRTYLTAAHRGAASQIAVWMREAGMTVRCDASGNVIGRYEGTDPSSAIVMTGSHFDTVRNGGKYDGPLGILLPIGCIAGWSRQGRRFPFPIEVVAFCEEEGVRFKAPLLGSRAIAGTFDNRVLDNVDEDGVTMREAMLAEGLDPAQLPCAAMSKGSIAAYLEVHIEQGPVLLEENRALGVVTAISGSSRFMLELEGVAGHAGTVPMTLRHDAAMAGAEVALYIEQRCNASPGLVGTVGQFNVPDGAGNVIPGRAVMSIDIRAGADALRSDAVDDIQAKITHICTRRGIHANINKTYEAVSVGCADWLQQRLTDSMQRNGCAPRSLPSGAGHDGMIIATIAPIAMLFVRCGNGGISHNPGETMSAEDAALASRVFVDFVENFSVPTTQ
ncbi:allantoate amidohydrolase [Marinobacter sp. BSs20148]|jgi:hydantoinase/carbamoylase family amidase|uniref:allantoate amidohydrolase n=1 Tax=Marinobacter sp. BSs20148 TaxID=490759 RepID=UPI00027774C8|nr:allantoate amidohydrolase [Marinobacter sp. BSs20148]AFP31220.1 N-carbamoyl-L-amino acid hydrolase [Marinobacter sp. BSs20148]